MSRTSESWKRLDTLISDVGEDVLLDEICNYVVEGDTLMDIASTHYGITYGVLWRWLNDESERMRAYEVSLKGHADMVVHETKAIADASDDPKLMVDTRKWLSSKWDRNRFSESSKVELSGSVSLINLLASLKELPAEIPKVIEGEAEEVFEFAVTSHEKIPEKISETEQVVI